MKIIPLAVSILLLHAGIAFGQTPAADAKRPITFLCPPCGLDCDTMHFSKPGRCPTCSMKLFAAYPGYENRLGVHNDYCDKKVAVLLFPGVEIIDFAGPWEVFGAAGMEVYSVAANDSVLLAGMGLKIKPDYSFANAPTPDILLVPGGNVDASDTAIVAWVRSMSQQSDYTLSVCTGAFFLAAGGLLDSLNATTNYLAIEALRGMAPSTSVTDTVRFVDNGRIITSAGLSSGMDAALHLVARQLRKAQTQKIANELEYGWSETAPFVRGKLADKHVQDFLDLLTPFDYTMTDYSGDRDNWRVSVRLKTSLSPAELQALLAIQFEQVSGWEKSGKKNSWSFEDYGKRWLAELSYRQESSGEFLTTLTVFRR